MSTAETTLQLGNIPILPVQGGDRRISMMLWGDSGCGKTTLAASAPGRKLLLNFDPDGPSSLSHRNDVMVADFSAMTPATIERVKSLDPFGVGKVIDEFDTLIIDSLTNVAQIALTHSITQTKGATLENPSRGGYAGRNAYTLQLVRRLLRLTGMKKKHVIFIAHEASPVTNEAGVVLYVTIMLGGQMPNQAGVDFSEVWAMTDTGRERRIAIRPIRLRKPMKSRMFVVDTPEFVLPKNTDTFLSDTFGKWEANEFQKLTPPSAPSSGKAPSSDKGT
jgi:hypothetical protein